MSDQRSDDVGGDVGKLLVALAKAMAGGSAEQHEFLSLGCAFLQSLEKRLSEHNSILLELSKVTETYQLTIPADKADEYVKQEMELLRGLKLQKAEQDELERHVKEIFANGLPANSVDREKVLRALREFREIICRAATYTAPGTRRPGRLLSSRLLTRIGKHVFQVVTIAGDSLAATVAFGGTAVGALPLVVAAVAAVGSIGGATMALLAELPETRETLKTEFKAAEQAEQIRDQHRGIPPINGEKK
jgi:hypothetical protein